MTAEQIESGNQDLRIRMSFELLEMSRIIEPTTLFGIGKIKSPSDFHEVFDFINVQRQKLDDFEF